MFLILYLFLVYRNCRIAISKFQAQGYFSRHCKNQITSLHDIDKCMILITHCFVHPNSILTRKPFAWDILNAHSVPFVLQHNCSLHVALARIEELKVLFERKD